MSAERVAQEGELSEIRVLVLGATGGFGLGITGEALARGHHVVGQVRTPSNLPEHAKSDPNFALAEFDIFDSQAIENVVRDADVVVFAINVPYEKWEALMPPALEATLRALRHIDTPPRLVFPGNVYALGEGETAAFPETAANAPTTRKGRIRDQMETAIKTASAEGLPVLIPRCADLFGPSVRNGLVDRIFGNAAAGKPINLVGSGKHPHQLTYMPDAARATLDLLARRDLGRLSVVNLPTHQVDSMSELARLTASVAGFPGLKVRNLPWFMVRAFGAVTPTMRELVELRYLFEKGVFLSNERRAKLLPDFAPTDLAGAVRDTVASYRTTGEVA